MSVKAPGLLYFCMSGVKLYVIREYNDIFKQISVISALKGILHSATVFILHLKAN